MKKISKSLGKFSNSRNLFISFIIIFIQPIKIYKYIFNLIRGLLRVIKFYILNNTVDSIKEYNSLK